MSRNVLPESRIHPAVREKVASYRADFIGELEQAIAAHEGVEWRKRLAIKMWTGWPTFPQIFVDGALVGGANDLEKLIASGEIPASRGGSKKV